MDASNTSKQDIKSVTSAWTSMSSTRVDPIDERLMKMLSTRSYEAVVQRAKANAMKAYQDCFGVEFNEEEALKILKEDEIKITININSGKSKAVAWGCDLTYDYVKINGSYRN